MMLPTIISIAVNLLEDTLRRSRRNAELILLVAAVALLLEFSFPQHAVAATPALASDVVETVVATEPTDAQLPLSPDREYRVTRSVRASITAYTSSRDETDGDPFTTASGEKVRDGIVAMNGVPFGTKVRIPDEFGNKIFIVVDRMHARYGTRYLDIWMTSKTEAKQWGVRRTTVEFVE